MRPRQIVFACIALVASTLLFTGDAVGQGLLRRLSNRVLPIVANQLGGAEDATAPANRLPARPLQTRPSENGSQADRGGSDENSVTNNPAARYRTPATADGQTDGVRRIPSIAPRNQSAAVPTPAVGPGGVKQAGASSPSDPKRTSSTDTGSSDFGRSILAPLDVGNDASEIASNSGVAGLDRAVATIGIKGVEANPGYPAVQVTEFASYSLAARDGLRVGDYLFAIDGVPTPNVQALIDEVSRREPGDRVKLRVGRAGQVRDIDITLVANGGGQTQSSIKSGYRPPAATTPQTRPPQSLSNSTVTSAAGIGAKVRDVPGRRGVTVAEIVPKSPAALAGLQADDRIFSINGKLVSNSSGFATLLAKTAEDASVNLQLIRNNQLVNASLDFGSGQESALPLDPDAAEPSGADSSGGTDAAAKPSVSGSLVGGLGSVLGGMFGQGASKTQSPPESPGGSEANQDKSKAYSSGDVDLLALEPKPLAPTQETLPDPKTTPTKDSETLRAEIQRLRDQLKSLESRLEN